MKRTESGVSLVEMLVATLMMAFISAGILGLAYMNWKTSQRIENKSDSANAARQAIDRLSFEIRQARSVGDHYGVVVPPTQQVVDMDRSGINDTTTDLRVFHADALPAGHVEQGVATLSSPSFPAPGNPQYDISNTSLTGWEDGRPALPYVLSNRCLVLQVPIFTPSGFPRAYAGAGLTQPVECLDTWVYRVVPSRSARGEWLLQVAGYPGQGSTMSKPREVRTILSGIVGPMGPDNTPRVFQYLLSSDSAAADTVQWQNVADISGVLVQLEIRRSQASAGVAQKGGQQAFVGFKQEVYLRNNSLTSLTASTR